MIPNYPSALDYLYSLPRFGHSPTLERMDQLLTSLGDPQKSHPTILITGTNGKGSVAALCHSLLTAGGYRVGLFTSPHLSDFRERFRIGSEMISPSEIVHFVNQMKPSLERLGLQDLCPSGFEAFCALGHLFFQKKEVDIAVCEVGLGGRLDPTNLSDPLACVLTQADLDHTQILGETREEIAREKLGILRSGIPLFSAEKTKSLQNFLEDHCREKGSPFFLLGREIQVQGLSASLYGQKLNLTTPFRSYENLFCPLLGEFQLGNIALALSLTDFLSHSGRFPLSEEAVRKGLSSVSWPGRLERISLNPLVLVDSGHNPHGIQALVESAKKLLKDREILLLAGFSKDKPYRKMMEQLSALTDEVVFSQASYRAVPVEELIKIASERKLFSMVSGIPSIAEALPFTLSKLGPGQVLLAAGGLFFAGEVREEMGN